MDAATLSQLACAATGIAAQLQRDEANAARLAAVTLDLERARMTAEDNAHLQHVESVFIGTMEELHVVQMSEQRLIRTLDNLVDAVRRCAVAERPARRARLA